MRRPFLRTRNPPVTVARGAVPRERPVGETSRSRFSANGRWRAVGESDRITLVGQAHLILTCSGSGEPELQSYETPSFNDGLAETGAAYFLAAPAHLQPEERAIAKEEKNIVLDLIQRLPQSQKEVLELKIADPDMKLEDIADALGIQLNAVKLRLHRARKALAARLEAEYPGDFTLLLRKWVDE